MEPLGTSCNIISIMKLNLIIIFFLYTWTLFKDNPDYVILTVGNSDCGKSVHEREHHTCGLLLAEATDSLSVNMTANLNHFPC